MRSSSPPWRWRRSRASRSALLPWLLVGGTLVLHHPFDPAAFVDQQRADGTRCDRPARTAGRTTRGGRRTGDANSGLSSVHRSLALHPTACRARPAWRESRHRSGRHSGLRRDRADSLPGAGPAAGRASSRSGRWRCRAAAKGGVIVGEVRATANGTVAMRGPMVPRCRLPARRRSARTLPQLKVAPTGFVDTGYACWSDQRQRAPGGDRAAARHGQRRRLSLRDARPAGHHRRGRRRPPRSRRCPMRMIGHRLAGSAADPAGCPARRWPSAASIRCWSAPSASAGRDCRDNGTAAARPAITRYALHALCGLLHKPLTAFS